MQQQQRVLDQANQLSASQQQQQDTDSFGGFGDLEQPADQLDAQLQGAGGFDAQQQQQQDAADEGVAAAAAGGDADELTAGLLHSPTPSGSGSGTGGQLGLRDSCHGSLGRVNFSGVRDLAQTGYGRLPVCYSHPWDKFQYFLTHKNHRDPLLFRAASVTVCQPHAFAAYCHALLTDPASESGEDGVGQLRALLQARVPKPTTAHSRQLARLLQGGQQPAAAAAAAATPDALKVCWPSLCVPVCTLCCRTAFVWGKHCCPERSEGSWNQSASSQFCTPPPLLCSLSAFPSVCSFALLTRVTCCLASVPDDCCLA